MLTRCLAAAEIATSTYEGEPVWELYAEYFGSENFMDQPVSQAFAGESSVFNCLAAVSCWLAVCWKRAWTVSCHDWT